MRTRTSRPSRRPRVYAASLILPVGLIIFMILSALGGRSTLSGLPNLSQGIGNVTCASAQSTAAQFSAAIADTKKSPPNYHSVETFGFSAPVNYGDIAGLRAQLTHALDLVNAKADTVANGTCTDASTAAVTDANGHLMILPLVSQDQPANPMSGSQTNADPRTVPITIGTPNNHTRTNSWGDLSKVYGSQAWYVACANSNLAMNWDSDVPRFMATEKAGHDSRFILAVNVSQSLTDDQIRQKAASDGNPDTGSLKVVRVGSIINTRNLGQHRCDPFVDARSMVRVSLGKVEFNPNGTFKGIETDKGAFVDCHNLWQLPKTPPVPTPSPTPSPSSPSPSSPGTTPPTTPGTSTPSPTCTPPQVPSPHGCLQPKDPSQGPVPKGNVPTPVQGSNPPAGPTAEPKPSSPPTHYSPPPPPATSSAPQPSRSVPPPETPAPQPSAPATGCVPPPGMQTC